MTENAITSADCEHPAVTHAGRCAVCGSQASEQSITELVDKFLEQQRDAYRSDPSGMSFTRSVQAFIAASDWIGAEHMPAVFALTAIAEQLDRDLTAALTAQFGVTFRDLRAQAPGSADDTDPIEAALQQHQQGAS